ncbi:MAG: prepilin peptidase, partial [Phycisphaerae bacterium]
MTQFNPSSPPIPSTTWRTLAYRQPTAELPKGLDAAWDAATGYSRRATVRTSSYLEKAAQVLNLEKEFTKLSDAQLKERAQEFKVLFRTGKETPASTLQAVALVREVAARVLEQRPYLEQVAGALALAQGEGTIVEMATGEGKTLTATMPATLAGWRGKGCHIITVNDYLAKRDAEWMGKIYRFCGLSTAYIEGTFKPDQRKAAYLADITYCTNKEVCADFSRDRLTLGSLRDLPSALLGKIINGTGTDRLVMRGLHWAIVDEADSVLIDEAVTPLIISGEAPNAEQVEAYQQAATLASGLVRDVDYIPNPRYREIELTDAGFDKITQLSEPFGGLWHGARRREELIIQALVAREYYLLGKQYVVSEGKVVIVDEFTGRLMPDRTWREGLHQAVEAKETLTVNPPKDTYSRISFQRFFRFYRALSGMTGTGAEATAELWQIYHRPVLVIPTHKPCIRKQLPDRVFATESAKYAAILQDIKKLHASGRPILIGTRSVRASERVSELLAAEHLTHAVLNAVRHAEEAQIVAGAGQLGRITV